MHRGKGFWRLFCQCQPVEKDGVVTWKEAPIVFEEAQVEALDLCVRRVDVHDIDLAARDGLVGELVLDSVDVFHLESVVSCKPGVAVLPSDEFVRQTDAQLGVLVQV